VIAGFAHKVEEGKHGRESARARERESALARGRKGDRESAYETNRSAVGAHEKEETMKDTVRAGVGEMATHVV
jgi:hypothetical protein